MTTPFAKAGGVSIKPGQLQTFSLAATINAVDPTLVRRVFLAHAADKLRDYEIKLPRVLGVDEKHILGGNRFVCMDVEGKKLLDMLPNRDTAALIEYFGRMPYCSDVQVFCQDMWRGYAMVAREVFPQAIVVIDRFHVVKCVNDAMSAARAAYQKTASAGDRLKLKGKNHLFVTRRKDLKKNELDQLTAIIKEIPFLGEAYGYKRGFLDLYEMDSRATAEAAYQKWRDDMPKAMSKFFNPLVNMMKKWGSLIFNYYDAPYTNGVVERMNRSIKDINTAGQGYGFDMLRAKALLCHGNIIPLGNLVAFNLMGVPEDKQDALLNLAVVHGIDPSTLVKALKAGKF